MPKEFIYLGHFIDDIYSILAKEEVMYSLVKETGNPLFMTCQVSNPSITVAEREDIRDIRVELCEKDGIHFTRRLGGGSVIWLDDTMLIYFLVVPTKEFSLSDLAKFKFHQEWGKKVGLALKAVGAKNVYIGERFSISLGKGPKRVISGNTVIIKKGFFSYHGVLLLAGLNISAVRKYIVLRKTEKLDEEEILSELPNLKEIVGRKINPEAMAPILTQHITDDNFRKATLEELKNIEARSLPIKEKYKSHSWIFEPQSITKRNAGFCLIAFSDSWDEKNFYRV